jgi:hypothetical protein
LKVQCDRFGKLGIFFGLVKVLKAKEIGGARPRLQSEQMHIIRQFRCKHTPLKELMHQF